MNLLKNQIQRKEWRIWLTELFITCFSATHCEYYCDEVGLIKTEKGREKINFLHELEPVKWRL